MIWEKCASKHRSPPTRTQSTLTKKAVPHTRVCARSRGQIIKFYTPVPVLSGSRILQYIYIYKLYIAKQQEGRGAREYPRSSFPDTSDLCRARLLLALWASVRVREGRHPCLLCRWPMAGGTRANGMHVQFFSAPLLSVCCDQHDKHARKRVTSDKKRRARVPPPTPYAFLCLSAEKMQQ